MLSKQCARHDFNICIIFRAMQRFIFIRTSSLYKKSLVRIYYSVLLHVFEFIILELDNRHGAIPLPPSQPDFSYQ